MVHSIVQSLERWLGVGDADQTFGICLFREVVLRSAARGARQCSAASEIPQSSALSEGDARQLLRRALWRVACIGDAPADQCSYVCLPKLAQAHDRSDACCGMPECCVRRRSLGKSRRDRVCCQRRRSRRHGGHGGVVVWWCGGGQAG